MAAGVGGELTPEQRRAIERLQRDPALRAALQRAAEVAATVPPGALENLASGLEVFRRRQRDIAALAAPALRTILQQVQLAQPALEQIARAQQEAAERLRVAVLAYADIHAAMARAVGTVDFATALGRIAEAVSVPMPVPTEDGLTQVADLIERGDVDEETLVEAERGLAGQEELTEAIDAAAGALAESRPFLSRDRARQIVVFWVWLMYGTALWAVAALTDPVVAAVPGAIGLPSAPAAAKRAGEILVPRRDDPQ
ncbi:hypothetical protein [Blastococcus sp. TF02-8]|uniref:hypothetical protein n=1 Tax=Blastococcus sp. TF02-8 TaxID=2250574 RepID=UPI001412DB19|nr:hypothetical protein [Blastococcus sp. TF02-8]